MKRFALLALISLGFAAPSRAAPPRPVPIQILSATAKDKIVEGAQVILQKEGETSLFAMTDAKGKVSLSSVFADDATVKLLVTKDGYTPLVVQCPCAGMSYAVSETLGQTRLDAFRVVLNWGARPSDLDLHTMYADSHVFFASKDGKDGFLDVDDTDSYGPETVTIQKRHAGEKYVFAIHNYSDRSQVKSRGLSASGAKVFVYVGESLIRSYYIKPNQVGGLWVLFSIDAKGAIQDIDKVVGVASDEDVPRYLGQIIENESIGSPVVSDTSAINKARTLLVLSKIALKFFRPEDALVALSQAIEKDPNLTEAFTLLSQTYAKLGRTAEANWYNRKSTTVAASADGHYRIASDHITATASSTLAPWKHYTFTADNLLDDNLWSSWQPVRKPNGGVGQFIQLTFDAPQVVTGLEIYNGFRLVDELGDLYAMNNRIKDGELQFSDGTSMAITFEDSPVQVTFNLPEAKTLAWVKLVVKSVYKGSRWNDLAVSELHVLGQ